MSGKKRSRFPFAVTMILGVMLSPAHAGDPSVRDLIALAPVLDSSDENCHSLDIGGYFGDDKEPGPKLRFRALYRAPDSFSLLLSDPADGTPLAYCSGKKIFVYDPVGPAVYYSEVGGFHLAMNLTSEEMKFKYDYFLSRRNRSHISLDLRSILKAVSDIESATHEMPLGKVVKLGEQKYTLNFKDESLESRFRLDLGEKCPYTTAALIWEGLNVLCFDRIVLNGPIDDNLFAFPAKERLQRSLPLKDMTAVVDPKEMREIAEVVGRAGIVREIGNRPGTPVPLNIPGLSEADWNRAKASDKKYAKKLRELVPSKFHAH